MTALASVPVMLEPAAAFDEISRLNFSGQFFRRRVHAALVDPLAHASHSR